jgi:NDP-sugar pyrophosphorylase family protein
MNYRVFIPSAGIGSRLGGLTENTNKALVRVAGKEVITYIINKFPKEVNIVIALGYKGNQIRDFLEKTYPDRNFTFVNIDNYDGPGSGLGYTMLQCKDQLQCPFIFISNDTLVIEDISEPDKNYMGYASERDVAQFRSVRLEGDKVVELCEKGATGNVRPYIGLAGVKDWEEFWKILLENKEEFMKIGESAGLRYMIEQGISIQGVEFTWFDTGNLDDLAKTEKVLKETSNNLESK